MQFLPSLITLLLTLSWIYSVSITAKLIVSEKELRLKEVRIKIKSILQFGVTRYIIPEDYLCSSILYINNKYIQSMRISITK